MQRSDVGHIEAGEEAALRVELEKIMSGDKGGFAAATTLSALAAVFHGRAEVFVPSLNLLTGETARLPVRELGGQGFNYIALLVEIRREHQAAVWVNIQDDTVTIIDSQHQNHLPKEAALRLTQLLGMDQSQFIFATPIEEQNDDWSCGVHVITNLLFQFDGHKDDAPLAERAERYLRLAHAHDQQQTKQCELDEAQRERTRKLLYQVETFRFENGFYQQNADDTFKTLANYLQVLVWGNVIRQSAPNQNDGRKNEGEAVLLAQSLREVCEAYKTKHPEDKIGLFILKLAATYEEQNIAGLTLAIETVMSLVNKQLPIMVTADNEYYHDDLINYRRAVSALTSEITLNDGRSQLTLFQLMDGCLQLRIEHSDDKIFLNHCIQLITQDEKQTELYAKEISKVLNKIDSLLLDLLWSISEDYSNLQHNKLSTERRQAAEKIACREQREKEQAAVEAFCRSVGMGAGTFVGAQINKVFVRLPYLTMLAKNGYFLELCQESVLKVINGLFLYEGELDTIVAPIKLYPFNFHLFPHLSKYLLAATSDLSTAELLAIEFKWPLGEDEVTFNLLAFSDKFYLYALAYGIRTRAGIYFGVPAAEITSDLLSCASSKKFFNTHKKVDHSHALIVATIHFDLEFINLFTTLSSVDVNAKCVTGETALIRAGQMGFAPIIEVLLKHPDINASLTDDQGKDALTYAAQRGSTSSMKALIKFMHPGKSESDVLDICIQHLALHFDKSFNTALLVCLINDFYPTHLVKLAAAMPTTFSRLLSRNKFDHEIQAQIIEGAWPPPDYNLQMYLDTLPMICEQNKERFSEKIILKPIKYKEKYKDVYASIYNHGGIFAPPKKQETKHPTTETRQHNNNNNNK